MLSEADELTTNMRASRVFAGWKEGPLTFPPTFKFKRGTGQYLGELFGFRIEAGGF